MRGSREAHEDGQTPPHPPTTALALYACGTILPSTGISFFLVTAASDPERTRALCGFTACIGRCSTPKIMSAIFFTRSFWHVRLADPPIINPHLCIAGKVTLPHFNFWSSASLIAAGQSVIGLCCAPIIPFGFFFWTMAFGRCS